MRLFIAYNAEPLQLKFLNWILERNDITKDKLMELVRNKEDETVKAVEMFVAFQSEVKRWANQLENSGNIFMDCIYEQCTNEDDSFKYVFGKKREEMPCKKHYEKAINDLYDAFNSCIDFSKEGNFTDRAKEVFNDFKKKNVKLEKLVNDMNQILIDNNKNTGNFDDADEKTISEMEQKSWENLEQNEKYHQGEWYIYAVDEYEDMRNVANKCSQWCVARAESGRSYFYSTYGPPFYLFCKGRHNPFILMHIESQQFKGLDDQKFEADRPTSYEAIEIGRAFLESIGELRSHYNSNTDFDVFNEGKFESEPLSDSEININDYTDNDMYELLDKQNSFETIQSVLNNSTNCDVILKAFDKFDMLNKEYNKRLLLHTNIIIRLMAKDFEKAGNSVDKIKKVYERVLSYQGFSENTTIIGVILMHPNEEIFNYFLNKLGGKKVLVDYATNSQVFDARILKRLADNGMKPWIESILLRDNVSYTVCEEIVKAFPNDEEMLDKKLDRSIERLPDPNFIYYVLKYTTSKKLIEKAALMILDKKVKITPPSIRSECEEYLWRKIDNRKIEKKLFDEADYALNENDEVCSIMMGKAKNDVEILTALRHDKSGANLNKYFDEHIDELEYNGKNDDWSFFLLFSVFLKDDNRLKKLYEKVNYDFEIVVMHGRNGDKELEDLDKALSRKESLTLDELRAIMLLVINKSEYKFSDKATCRRMVVSIFEKSENESLRHKLLYTIFSRDFDDSELIKELFRNEKTQTLICNSVSCFQILFPIISEYYETLFKDPQILEKCFKVCIEVDISDDDASSHAMNTFAKYCTKDMLEQLSKKYYDEANVDCFKREEFEKGMLDPLEEDEIMTKLLNECQNGGVRLCSTVMGMSNHGNMFEKCLNKMLGMETIPDNIKRIAVQTMLDNEQDEHYNVASRLHGLIDVCFKKQWKSLYSKILCSPSADETQIRKAIELINEEKDEYKYDIDCCIGKATPTALNVLSEMSDEGELDVNWENVVYNKKATSDDLMRVVDMFPEYGMEEDTVYQILNHPNCTQEIAEAAIANIDPETFIENYGTDSLMKWTSAVKILEYDENIGQRLITTADQLEDVAKCAKTEKDFDAIIEHVENTDDYDDDDYDAEGNSELFKNLFQAIARNPNCTKEYLEKMTHNMDDNGDKGSVIRTYIKNHTKMPTSDISYFIEKYASMINGWFIDDLIECENMTEELMVFLIRKYNYIPMYHIPSLISKPFATEKVLLEEVEIIVNQSDMIKVMSSPNMTDAVYRRILELNTGRDVMQRIFDDCKNEEIKKKAREKLTIDTKYGLAEKINGETDEEQIKKDVVTLYRQFKANNTKSYEGGISALTNARALEMMSHTKDSRLIEKLIKNQNLPVKTALSMLKKNPSNENMKSVADNRSEKELLMYVCCMAKDESVVESALGNGHLKMFSANDIMRMLKWNPSCKFVILKKAYFKFTDEQLLSLKKFRDKDMNWIIDYVLSGKNNKEDGVKANAVIHRLLKASRIIRNIMSDNGFTMN